MTFSVCISMTISVMPANFLYILFQSGSKKTILVFTVWCCHDSHGSTTTPGLYLSVSHGTMHSFRPIIYLSSIIHHWVVLSSALSLWPSNNFFSLVQPHTSCTSSPHPSPTREPNIRTQYSTYIIERIARIFGLVSHLFWTPCSRSALFHSQHTSS